MDLIPVLLHRGCWILPGGGVHPSGESGHDPLRVAGGATYVQDFHGKLR